MGEQTCMVCGKSFNEEDSTRWNHDGAWYRFDNLGFRIKFIGNQQKYLQPEETGS